MQRGRGRGRRPRVEIDGYNGPYNRSMLENARATLMQIIDSKDTVLWNRIRLKTGIYSNGERNTSDVGWGQASCDFSHADLHSDDVASTSASMNIQPNNHQEAPQELELGEIPDDTDCILLDGSALPDVIAIDSSDSGNDSFNQIERANSSNKHGDPVFVTIDCTGDSERGSIGKREGSECKKSGPNRGGDADRKIMEDNEMNDIEVDRRSKSGFVKIEIEDSNDIIVIPDERQERERVSFRNKEMVDRDAVRAVKDEVIDERGVSFVEDKMVDYSVKDEMVDRNEDEMLERKGVVNSEIIHVSGAGRKVGVQDHCESEPSATLEQNQNCTGSSEPRVSGKDFILKCDFCDEVSRDPGMMTNHLLQSVHYSASSFHCNTDDQPLALIEKLVLANKQALYKSVLAVCPYKSCRKVFSTIHECILHYRHEHDASSPPTYALVEVTKEVICDIDKNERKCPTCSYIASGSGKLMKHCKKEKHYSFEQKTNGKYYFFCHLCQKFKESFGSAYQHKADHDLEMDDEKRRLSVLYGAEKVIHQLPDGLHPNQPSSKRKAVAEAGNSEAGHVLKKVKTEKTTKVKSDLTEGYKCDYCDISSDNEKFMLSHMRAKLHNSASLVFMDSSHIPIYMKKPCALMVDTDERAFMAKCPVNKCNQFFNSTYVCSEHYSFCHEETSDPAYGVAKVESQESLMFRFTDVGYVVPNEAANHVKEISKTAFNCFICSICNRSFPNYESVARHLRKHRSKVKKGLEGIPVNFLCVSKSKVKHELLPFRNDKQGELDCINGKITNLRYLKGFQTKLTKKQLTKKIKELKMLKSEIET